MSFLSKCIIITIEADVKLNPNLQLYQSNIVQFDAPVSQNGRGQIRVNLDEMDAMVDENEFPVKSCDQFQFLEMNFVPIAVSDPDEYIFVSDTEEYLVTKSETAWLLQSIVDNELIMFGLSGRSLLSSATVTVYVYSDKYQVACYSSKGTLKGGCPNESVWYWTNTMDRVWDDDFDVIAHHSVSDSEEKCIRTHVEEPVSITHFILNDFEDGIIFTFKEIENIEIQVLFSNELPVNKITGNVELKDSSGKTSIVSLNNGDVRSRSNISHQIYS